MTGAYAPAQLEVTNVNPQSLEAPGAAAVDASAALPEHNITLEYPTFQSEVDIVKNTTSDVQNTVNHILDGKAVMNYQHLVRRVPIADNVVEYAVGLVHKTRVNNEKAPAATQEYIEWGAGPRASQSLVIAAKCHALINGKYSPDIEDVQAVAKPILRHRIIRNFKAEAEGVTIDKLIEELR